VENYENLKEFWFGIFMEDLKLVYKANSKDLAESKLIELEEKWGKKYPLVLKSWNNN